MHRTRAKIKKTLACRHSLSVAAINLDLLARILEISSTNDSENDLPSLSSELDIIFSDVEKLSEKVEMVYQCISLEHQMIS